MLRVAQQLHYYHLHRIKRLQSELVSYQLCSGASVNINSGFRYARVPQMIQAENVSYSGIPGITVPDSLVFDFSGASIGAGLSLGF